MKTIEQTYVIQAPRSLVWQALTDSEDISGWGGGSAIMDDEVGTEFKLWGGSIWGKNKEVVPQQKLVQDWYDDEDLPEATLVTLTLEDITEGTKVTLHHTNIPESSAEGIEEGWKKYYLGPLKHYVETTM